MAVQPGVWGIDLGQCGLKALRIETIDGRATATAFDYVEHPKILSQPDADPDQLTREALEKFLSRNSIRGDIVVVSIPGQSGLARFVKLPPVEEKKIPDIVRFEAKQQIPFNLDEVVWDYQKLGSGAVTDGFAMETEIGLFAIKRDTVMRYLQHFKDVNVEVNVVQMAPLALCNYVSYDLLELPEGGEGAPAKKQCVVALDIGTDASNLVITDGQRIIWQRPIPLGGNHFTRALTKDMKLTFAKAEHLKRNATKSPDLKQILSSLKPVLNDFVSEVQRSLGYFTQTHRDANVQYMIGLGSAFRLPGLQKFISEKLQLDVRRLSKLEKLVGDDVVQAPAFTENVLSFAVAYGLALQGLKVARLHTNLLPNDIRVERMIRAKKPWAVAAAAVLLFSMCSLALGYNLQYRAVAATQVKDAMTAGTAVITKADGYKRDVDKVIKQIDEDKKAVKSIIIGQEERRNWMLFNQFVNKAMPRPDGSNLSPEARQLFWTKQAADAYKLFMEQQKGGKNSDRIDEEGYRDDLVQANVESVFCIYCDDLAAFHKKLMGNRKAKLYTMSDKDQKNPPDGKTGWLVEVQGYTWNRGATKFVAKAIVDNFARLPIKSEPAVGGPGATKPGAAASLAPASEGSSAPDKMAHPIWSRVSHAVLFDYADAVDPDPQQFSLIKSSVIATFAQGGGKDLTGRSGGRSRSWTPIGARVGDSGAAAGGGGGGLGLNLANPSFGAPVRATPPPPDATASTAAATPTTAKKGYRRTEFIIFFVWREPIPSEALLGTPTEGAGAAAGGQGGGFGFLGLSLQPSK
jgi:type IV pilus assembly protein PilM